MHDHQDQPSPPMSIHSSLKGQGIKSSVTIFTSIGLHGACTLKLPDNNLAMTYFRKNLHRPERNPGDSVILVAGQSRLAENVRILLLHA
jgi:hypothetical protein